MEGNISSTSGKEIKIEFRTRNLSPAERKKIALKNLGIFWGLSLVSLPLPPIHWVTVPGFFIYGIFAFFKKLRENQHFEASSFPCPECQAPVPLPPQVVRLPLEIVCPSCRYLLKLNWNA